MTPSLTLAELRGRATISVAKAASATVLTAVTAKGGADAVGVPITLKAVVTDASHTTATPGGTVEFKEGKTPVAGCSAVAAAARPSLRCPASAQSYLALMAAHPATAVTKRSRPARSVWLRVCRQPFSSAKTQ